MQRGHLHIALTALVVVGLILPFLILHHLKPKNEHLLVSREKDTLSLKTDVEGILVTKTSTLTHFETSLETSFLHDFTSFVEREAKSRFLDLFDETAYCAVSPSLVRRGESLLVAFQIYHCPMKQRSEYRVQPSFIFVQSFDRNLSNDGYGHFLGYGAPKAQEFGPQRPRAFQIGDRPYLTFHPGIKGYVKDIVTWPVMWDVIDRAPIIPRPGTFGDVTASEEWLPVVVEDKAYFVQAFEPELKVVQCQMNGHCSQVAAEQGDLGRRWELQGGAPFQLYRWPYYVSLVTGSSSREYNTSHLVVLQAEPFRIIYVSEHIPVDSGVFQGRVMSPYISRPSYTPSGLLIESKNSAIFTASINDAESGMFRLRGLKSLMDTVIKQGYSKTNPPNTAPEKPQSSDTQAAENLQPASAQRNEVFMNAEDVSLAKKNRKGPSVIRSSDWNAKRMNVRNEDRIKLWEWSSLI